MRSTPTAPPALCETENSSRRRRRSGFAGSSIGPDFHRKRSRIACVNAESEPRRYRPCRGQPEQLGATVAQARLSRDRPSQTSALCLSESGTGAPANGFRNVSPPCSRATGCARDMASISSIMQRICPRPFMFRRSPKRSSSHSMGSAISPARHGESGRGPRSGSTAASFSRIRSASSIEALTRYLGFPHYGDEYKVMGLGALWQPDLS